MNTLPETAPAFVAMAHQIVWATVATVDGNGRPRSRILHPIWQWDGTQLVGWIATGPTAVKRAHLQNSPFVSVNYWTPSHDTCAAECRVTWAFDDQTRQMVWDLFLNGPEPVGYDPRIVPAWTSPTVDAFAALKLEPWRLRVFPGTVLMGQGGSVLTWQDS
ncbi:MAG: pyridoxamine 5'-phosphate oxidase family protein [Anaerolineae bacterium]|nr:pyridoxamine 5'-phosphate oxidase family protein [Anaerolineae bacterium]